MGLEADAEDQLFLLEIVIESITLRLDRDDECNDSREDPPWTVSFRLCNTFSFEMAQEDGEKTEENICPRTKECTVKFHAGKSCLFTANPSRFLQVIQENAIFVTVSTQYADSVAPDILGHGEIEFEDSMITELCTCLKEDSFNSETSCKGCYPLCDSKQVQVGVIQLYLRLSFYGKCILSEFKLLSGMDNILFKVQNEDESNKCFKCGKSKVKPTTSEDSEADLSESSLIDVSQPWKNTYDCQKNYLAGPSKSYGEPDYLKYGKGSVSPGYTSNFTNNYENYGRTDDLLRFDDILKKDSLRQGFNQPCGDKYPSFSRESNQLKRLSCDNGEFSLNHKTSSDSIDFRKIIGEDTIKYPLTDDTRSYITPMLDFDEKEYAMAELKVKRAPKLKAGPKRRRKLKTDKLANFDTGVKIGHKECVKQTKNVPKRSGWLWPEKTKKTPGWKPGSMPRKIAEILDSSRIDGEGGKGDFTRKSLEKKEVKNEVTKAAQEEVTEDTNFVAPAVDGNDQPSLHFKMCGGSYMISVNPAALGDKSKERKNQNGLFMRLNQKENVNSSASDLEIAFTTPRVQCDPPIPVETKENKAQCIPEDVPQVPGTPQSSSRGKQRTDSVKGRDDEMDNRVATVLMGGIGKVNGAKKTGNQSRTDEKMFQNSLKELESLTGNAKNEKGKKAKTPSEGDSPKIIVWDEDQETAVGQLRTKPAKKK